MSSDGAVSKLRFVEKLTGTSSGETQQSRQRCIGQPDHAFRFLPSNAAPSSGYCSQRSLLTIIEVHFCIWTRPRNMLGGSQHRSGICALPLVQ
jgi:hypothetical protein